MFGVNPLFGSLFEIGFAGGHGTAGGMASVFKEQLNWADGADLAMTTATIGLLCGIFGGMIIINYGVRKKYTKVLTEPATGGTTKEVFPEGSARACSYDHQPGRGRALRLPPWHYRHFHSHRAYHRVGLCSDLWLPGLPLFPFAMIGGWLLNAIMQRTSLRDLLDRNIFQRIQGMALEILVVGAMASIKIPVVLAYWAPLLIGSVVIIALMVLWFFWLSPGSSRTVGLSRVSFTLVRSPVLPLSAICFFALPTPKWKLRLEPSMLWTARS